MLRSLLLLSPLLLSQVDPVAAARKDLGPGFAVEQVEPGILLAMPAGENDGGTLRESIRKAVKTFRKRALDAAPQNSLLILRFGSAESYAAFTARRYGAAIPQTTYYDVLNRRVLLRTEAAKAYALQVCFSFLLTDSINDSPLPPWIAAALPVLDEPDPEPAAIDRRAALLREAVRRGTLPALRPFFGLDLRTFHGRDVLSLHASLSLKFAEYLEQRGALKKFFEEYRRTYRKDPAGAAAVEAALGGTLDAIEKEFVAHVKALPWLDRERFLDEAKKVFGPSPLIQVDEDLMLAVTGSVEPRVASQALDQVRKLRGPLLRLFDLRTSGLPVVARLFKDKAAFQEYAKTDAPHRRWVGGYFAFDSRRLVLHLEPDSGSLTHEYCHALFEDDLGPVPAWFGEGIAQLYEEFRLENGVPIGARGSSVRSTRTGIAQNRLAPLQDFVQFKGLQFYDPDLVNLHYEASHALMVYVQDRGGLVPLMKELHRLRAADPAAPPVATCRKALEKALGADMAGIDAAFRAWVASSRD